jgi:hypothetical protein
MGSFQPPKSATFKQFVILDADGVVSALSAIDGGQIDEILTRSAEEKGGEAGGEINVGPVKGKGKRGKTRKVEEEIRLARTRHAAASKLLDALHAVTESALWMDLSMMKLQTKLPLEWSSNSVRN